MIRRIRPLVAQNWYVHDGGKLLQINAVAGVAGTWNLIIHGTSTQVVELLMPWPRLYMEACSKRAGAETPSITALCLPEDNLRAWATLIELVGVP